MTEESRNELLQKLIFSAQNENKFTLLDLNDYLLSEHVVSDEDAAFFKDELRKMGLLIEEDEGEDSDYIEEPTSDEIEEIEDDGEEDELLGDDEDDEDLIDNTSIDLIEEPTVEDLDKVEEEESEDEDDGMFQLLEF